METKTKDRITFPGNPDAVFEKDEEGNLIGYLLLPAKLIRMQNIEDYLKDYKIIFLRSRKPKIALFRNKTRDFNGHLYRVLFKAPASCEIDDLALFSGFFHRWEDDVEPTYSINGFGQYESLMTEVDLFIFKPKHDVLKTHTGAVLIEASNYVSSITEIRP